MPSVVEIYDPKKRNEIIEEHLRMRKRQKTKNIEEQEEVEKLEENRVDIFKPLIDSNKAIQNEIIDEKNKIIETLNNFGKLTIMPSESEKIEAMSAKKNLPKPVENTNPENSNHVVSATIAKYLQDNTDRSNAGYSMKYNTESKNYIIGNQELRIRNNNITVDDIDYSATDGLMELLLKKSPNIDIVTDQDIISYFNMLRSSNAIYQGFDKTSKRFNSDKSDKWEFIRTNYKQERYGHKSGSSIGDIEFLPSNINSLLEMLRLSIASYQAGNNGEFNKINSIIDELVKMKKIKKSELKQIYKNF